MRITVLPVKDLSSKHVEIWREIQDDNYSLNSPYFCPEFFIILGEVRGDIFVSVIEDGDQIVGFFPFQKKRFGVAVPAGGMLSDIHGIIARDYSNLDLEEIMKKSNLKIFEFYHIPKWQNLFDEYVTLEETFYTIDIRKGYEDFIDFLKEKKSKTIKDSAYKLRKLKRDYDKVEIRHLEDRQEILDTLFLWKSMQYQKSNLIDVFSFSWTKEFINEIFHYRSDTFSGILSVLYVNDLPIAIHMGMCSLRSWNWWFPRHDNSFSKYSPGILLRLNAIEYAAEKGLWNVDLGCGDENSYKPHLSTDSMIMRAGVVELPSITVLLRKVLLKTEHIVRESFLYILFKIPGRLFFSYLRKGKFK